jgi:hypothetical protein
MEEKKCNGCGNMKPLHDFYIRKSGRQNGKVVTPCKQCMKDAVVKNTHLRGHHKSMYINKECPSYLGIVIAEKALSKFYKHIKRMPINNPGYDFECDKGYFIDVKSSCLRHPKIGSPCWSITIKKNSIANYFLCVLFNDRIELKPVYVLLIPGELVRNKVSISITNTPKGMTRWRKYMQPLDNVISCCNAMRDKLDD